LNADGIIGVPGKILSLNIFAYCNNNAVTMCDQSGFRPIYTMGEETNAMREASYRVMNNNAINQTIVYSQMKDLGYKKWRYRHDPANNSTRENEHVHIEGNGKKCKQDILGNRRKGENSLGDPPQKAKDALKEKDGWDWDANAKKRKSK